MKFRKRTRAGRIFSADRPSEILEGRFWPFGNLGKDPVHKGGGAKKMDPILKEALAGERARQENNIELIASENYPSNAVLELQGSILNNKYAEGYPGRRYYGGCEYIDIFERQARAYAKELFHVKYVNVQPHSGSSANMAAYRAILKRGDKIMGMRLSDGGHLTHGSPVSFSGEDYQVVQYGLDPVTEQLNYEAIRQLALKEKPNLIVAGASAYSRTIDFKKFREIADEAGALLMVDMAHIAGLVACGLHPSPCPYADIITTTTHKTLRGPRGGMILTNDKEIYKKVNHTIFPGIQGGPLMHVIGAKAQALFEALQPDFLEYQKQVIANAKALSDELIHEGFKLVAGGTDNHMVLLNVKSKGITGKDAEELLDRIHITANKNTIPNETESPAVSSGLRLGTPAMTSRGFKEDDFRKIAQIISQAIENRDNESKLEELSKEVLDLTARHPLWYPKYQ